VVPPRKLRTSVGQPSATRYATEGEIVANELTALLRESARPLDRFSSICDLASGPGKVLTRLEIPGSTAIAAIDVNAEAIAWLSGHVPRIDARAEQPLPPTSFPDESFDLIVSISLFTHLPESSQFAWLAEVNRLLTKDGIAVLTTHGETAYEGFREARRPGITTGQLSALRARGSLEAEGFVFEPEPNPTGRSPGVESTYGLAFHSHAYVRDRWGEILAIERVLPAAINFRQDAVIARRLSASR
jgi:SAM-dependent methyltransferase